MVQTLSALPHELLLDICEQISLGDLARFVRTSRFFAGIGTLRLYDSLFFHTTSLKTNIAGLRSQLILDYVAVKSEKLLRARDVAGRSFLHYIAAAGNEVLLAVFLKQGADISVRCDKGKTPLYATLEEGRDATAVQLLDAGADVLTPAKHGATLELLHKDLARPTVERVILAIRAAGGDVSACGPNGHTPLHYASRHGHDRIVNILVEHGADVLAPNLILLGAMTEDPRGYDINAPIASLKGTSSFWVPDRLAAHYQPGDTILHCAAGTFSAPIIKLLLDRGANPLAENNPDHWPARTPFDIAVQGRCPELVSLIAEMHNTPEFWKSNGYIQSGFETCLHEAYLGTVTTIVDLYKQGKVELDIAAATPSMLKACTYHGDHVMDDDVNNSITTFLSAGADINAQDTDGKTALHLLCDGQYTEHSKAKFAYDSVVRRIIQLATDEQKATVASRNNHGQSVLHLYVDGITTSSAKRRSTIQLLLDAGCGINDVDNEGRTIAQSLTTPLLSMEAAAYLLGLGLNLSLHDNKELPPFHYLMEVADLRGADMSIVAKYLVDHGVNLHEGCKGCASWVLQISESTPPS
ncbi:ankyrin repeat-containing domain protein [Aspergillus spectabilis]